MRYVLLLSLVLFGCGKGISYKSIELLPYLNLFQTIASEQRAIVSLEGLDILLTDIEQPIDPYTRILGDCMPTDKEKGQIRIDKTFFNNATQTAIKIVIFHELGHCLLNRRHKDVTYLGGRHKSIMSTYRLRDDEYNTNPEEYHYELFHGSN